jgi:osmoprotectant transport system substrate-binding protein
LNRTTRRIAPALAALTLASGLLLAAGCGDDDDDGASGSGAGDGVSVTIGDKGFTESFIVAQAYAQALADEGFATDVTSLASTEIADGAIRKGDIDVYPEYTGTAYLNVLGNDAEDAPEEREAQFEEIQTAYGERGLVALDPAPYNNGNEVACTEESGITTLEQLGEESGDIVYSANAEHLTRPDGLPLLEQEYGVDFEDVITVDISLRYQPIEDGKAQCVYAFGTDPAIAEQDLVVLEDGKGIFTGGVSFQNFAVVNQEFYDGLTDDQREAFDTAINEVDAALSADTIRSLNAQVEFDKEDPSDVAAAFLADNGLVEGS